MRHAVAGNKLSRQKSHLKATLRDLAKATLIRQRICTTQAKAKEARKLIDKLITMGKKGTLAEKRRAFAVLCDHKLVSDLFNNIATRFNGRNGGYTRIIPLGTRRGDNAQMAYLELTEKVEVQVSQPKSTAADKKETKAKAVEKKVEEKAEKPAKAPAAPAEVKKEKVKQEKKDVQHDATKDKKTFVGGIRKLFNRKQGM